VSRFPPEAGKRLSPLSGGQACGVQVWGFLLCRPLSGFFAKSRKVG